MRRSLSPLLVLPGFLGFTVAIPSYQSANATERDDNGTNADVGANSKSASLESFCAAQLSSFTATYQSTEIATSRWTWYEGFGPTDSAGDLTGSVTSQTYWTSTFLCKYCEMQDILFVIYLFLLFPVFSLLGFPIPIIVLILCSFALSPVLSAVSLTCLRLPFQLRSALLSSLLFYQWEPSAYTVFFLPLTWCGADFRQILNMPFVHTRLYHHAVVHAI